MSATTDPAAPDAATDVAGRLRAVRDRIDRAADRSGRDPASVRLVAVSKKQPTLLVREAWAAGQREFGENYAQEMVARAAELAGLDGIAWHLVGHLQSNKARHVAACASWVQTIDSPQLAAELGRRAARAGRRIAVLVEVNVAGDEAKSGCRPSDLADVVDAVEAQASLELRGLMTMPPWTIDPEGARPFFSGLRTLRSLHGGAARLPDLSMGMSHDLEVAVAEGATIVRVGTAVFGERPERAR